jgi:uncharacterized protein (DUF58 family)
MHGTLLLPNRNTLGLGAVLVAMWYAGMAQSNGAAHLLGFLLAALAAVSAVHAWTNLRGVRVQAGRIAPVFAGESLCVPLRVEAAPGTTPTALRIEAGNDAHDCTIDTIRPEHEQRVVAGVPAQRRGCFSRMPITVRSQYPLGFFTARRRFTVEQEYCVYPRPAGTAPLPQSETAVREQREGVRVAGDDFAGVRPWLHGESQRHIDWKAAARGQPLLSKQWAGDAGDTVLFDWRDTPPGDVESRLSQLAQWIVTAERAGSRYGLTLPGGRREPDRGEAHFHACLRMLAAFSAEDVG